MTRLVTVAATRMACSWELDENLDGSERLVRDDAARGADVVLLQELFATPYLSIEVDPRHFDLARPVDGRPVVERF